MGCQFFHIEGYSRELPTKKAPKGKKQGAGQFFAEERGKSHTVRTIMQEAKRDPEASLHVKAPLPPTVIYGDLDTVEALATEWAEGERDTKGRKLRKDAKCLLAGVLSVPNDVDDEGWELFKRRSLQWLKDKYGARLRAVASHTDEPHKHLHFYCVPLKGERWEVLHDGRLAQSAFKGQKDQTGAMKAYADAMRALQDDFSDKVGQPVGLTRVGPHRRRLTRVGWHAEQAQAKANAQAMRKAKQAKRAEQATTAKAEQEAQSIREAAYAEAEQIKQEAKGFGALVGSMVSAGVEVFTGSREQLQARLALEQQARQDEERKAQQAHKHYERVKVEREEALRGAKTEATLKDKAKKELTAERERTRQLTELLKAIERGEVSASSSYADLMAKREGAGLGGRTTKPTTP